MINPFISTYKFFNRRKLIFWFSVTGLLLISGYLAFLIRFEEDVFRMVPGGKDSEKLEIAFKNASLLDKLVIRIYASDSNSKDPDVLIEACDKLVASLKDEFDSTYIKDILYSFEGLDMDRVYDEFYDKLPLYLDEEDYLHLDTITSADHVIRKFQDNYNLLISPAGISMKKFLVNDPLGITGEALKKLENLQLDSNFDLYKDHIITQDKNNLLILITPANASSETLYNTALIDGIEKASERILEDFPGLGIEHFGASAVAVANARQVKQDVMITVGAAFLLVLLIMMLYFRQKRMLLVLIIPVVFGGSIALAVLFLAKTMISAIALGVGSLLVGITIDYALHFFTHYQNTGSAEKVLKDVTSPVLYSAMTTAAAFFCLSFVNSYALRDMGWFAGISVIFASLASLFILPHLVKARKRKTLLPFISGFASFPFHKKKYLKWLIIILGIVSAFFFRKVEFEGDLENMSYMTDELIAAQENLNEITTVSLRTIYTVNLASELETALRMNEELGKMLQDLEKEGLVQSYILPADLLVSDQMKREKVQRWKDFWEPRKEDLITAIDIEAKKYKFREGTFSRFKELISNSDNEWMQDKDFVMRNFLSDYVTINDSLVVLISPLKVKLEDKDAVHAALADVPDLLIIDKQYVARQFVDTLKEDFNLLVVISLIVVFIILLLLFGRFELAAITFIPMLISWIITLGLMAMLGIKFTIFNIIISTFIFGLGIDYSIFITRGMMQKLKYNEDKLNSYKTSIFLSALTTISGIGVLIFAKHPALQSMALVSIIGIFTVMIVAYTLQPGLFNWLIRSKGRKRFAPIVLLDFIFSLVCITVFVSGTFIVTALGVVLLFLAPISRKKARYLYHYLIKLACWFQIYVELNIKKTVLGFSKEKFRKPSVIIANHESHIDILLVLMLYPKIIVLTNERVHKRIYGALVKMADFYPITSDGIDATIGKIEQRVNEGYSILVFPEGTRSDDPTIHRFHRGAFYIAEKLSLDILPVIFHGVGDCMKKGELFLRGGHMSMRILDRIPVTDTTLGKDYKERTKLFRKYIIEEYNKLAAEYGGARYHRRTLLKNFVFRGQVLDYYLRVKLRMEKNYRAYDMHTPQSGVITDLGCGYGFISYMLAFLSKDRKLIAIDYDEEKINVARNAFYKNDQLEFICDDISKAELSRSDAFIISDVLHYIPQDDQKKLIDRCVEKLNKNGLIIIREGDMNLRRGHLGTRFSEFLSTKVMRFNKTDDTGSLYFTNRDMVTEIAREAGMEIEIIDNAHLTSNIMMLLKKTGK